MDVKRHRVCFRSIEDFASSVCSEISLLFRDSFAKRTSPDCCSSGNGNAYQLQAVNNSVSELV
jgi:hypothetical protein